MKTAFNKMLTSLSVLVNKSVGKDSSTEISLAEPEEKKENDQNGKKRGRRSSILLPATVVIVIIFIISGGISLLFFNRLKNIIDTFTWFNMNR